MTLTNGSCLGVRGFCEKHLDDSFLSPTTTSMWGKARLIPFPRHRRKGLRLHQVPFPNCPGAATSLQRGVLSHSPSERSLPARRSSRLLLFHPSTARSERPPRRRESRQRHRVLSLLL